MKKFGLKLKQRARHSGFSPKSFIGRESDNGAKELRNRNKKISLHVILRWLYKSRPANPASRLLLAYLCTSRFKFVE